MPIRRVLCAATSESEILDPGVLGPAESEGRVVKAFGDVNDAANNRPIIKAAIPKDPGPVGVKNPVGTEGGCPDRPKEDRT